MGYAMFIIGGMLFMSALIVYWLGYRLCCKIAKKAMRLDVVRIVLCFTGMIIMAIGGGLF